MATFISRSFHPLYQRAQDFVPRKPRTQDNKTSTLCNDVDRASPNFCNLFMNTLDSFAPLREVRIKQRSEPWMTSAILDDINERDSFLAKFNKNKHMSEYYQLSRVL